MGAARIRYELRVGTHVGTAALSTFGVPVRPTAVPRRTLYRFRVPADRDLAEVLVRLTECDVEVLEIRQCPGGPRRDRGSPSAGPHESPGQAGDPPGDGDGVVLPFRAPRGTSRPDVVDPDTGETTPIGP
jgi:hypothetical protein